MTKPLTWFDQLGKNHPDPTCRYRLSACGRTTAQCRHELVNCPTCDFECSCAHRWRRSFAEVAYILAIGLAVAAVTGLGLAIAFWS